MYPLPLGSSPCLQRILLLIRRSLRPLADSDLEDNVFIDRPLSTVAAGPSVSPPRHQLPVDPVRDYVYHLLEDPEILPADITLIRAAFVNPVSAKEHLETLFISIKGNVAPRTSGRVAGCRTDVPARMTPGQRRAYNYKWVQELYIKDCSFLARNIIDGSQLETPSVSPPIQEIEEEYLKIFLAEPLGPDPPLYDVASESGHLSSYHCFGHKETVKN